jgi:hypothetical protein
MRMNQAPREIHLKTVSRLIGETRHGQTSCTTIGIQQSPTNQMSSETQYSKVNQTKSIGRSNTMARKRVANIKKTNADERTIAGKETEP